MAEANDNEVPAGPGKVSKGEIIAETMRKLGLLLFALANWLMLTVAVLTDLNSPHFLFYGLEYPFIYVMVLYIVT